MKKGSHRLLAFFVATTALLGSCLVREPHIESIDPRIGVLGDVLTIKGAGFGSEKGEGYVLIAGISPTASSYIEWKDSRIAVKIPDLSESGLVYVYVDDRKSNAALFTNRASMPQPVSQDDTGITPRILSVEPTAARIGEAITLTGRNFGAAREKGAVLFAWDTEVPQVISAAIQTPGTVEVQDIEFGYEFWSDREIRVRVPDGATDGSLTVKTDRGTAIPVFFETTKQPGTKIYKDKRSYVVNYSVDVKVKKASAANSLYLWIPRPTVSSAQKNAQLLSRSMEPFVDDHLGASLYQLKDMTDGGMATITLSYLVDVYSVETKVRTQEIKKDQNSPIRAAYTLPTAIIPADNSEISREAARIVGREKNPYLQAKKIYTWLVTEGGIEPELPRGGAKEAFEQKKADAYSAALLFCAMARSLGIPAIPVSGFLVDRSRTCTRHFWAEFWLDGFGWVPVDPALGAGVVPEGFTTQEDARTYYFGNLDNQRVTFSRGLSILSTMDPRGRVVARERGYALQTVWEEAVGGLESYSTLWSDLTVTGIY